MGSPKTDEEVKKDLWEFYNGDDAPPSVLALALLLNEFEVECQAILPRRRWLMINNRCLSFREETGEALLAMDCLRWLEKYTFNKLIYLGSENVLRSLLRAVRSELNEPTTDQTVKFKKSRAYKAALKRV